MNIIEYVTYFNLLLRTTIVGTHHSFCYTMECDTVLGDRMWLRSLGHKCVCELRNSTYCGYDFAMDRVFRDRRAIAPCRAFTYEMDRFSVTECGIAPSQVNVRLRC